MTLVAANDPTSIPAGVPEDAVDELYGLPLDEFTPRRDELAKELRRGGQRDAAAWVKGLRKPSAAAWIVNQLARTRARARRDLLRAGQELRDAHERVVAGGGDAGELRAAAEAEHAAAGAPPPAAPGFLDREGHAAPPPGRAGFLGRGGPGARRRGARRGGGAIPRGGPRGGARRGLGAGGGPPGGVARGFGPGGGGGPGGAEAGEGGAPPRRRDWAV